MESLSIKRQAKSPASRSLHILLLFRVMLLLAKLFARLFYRVSVRGKGNLPAGGFLLLPNHVTWVDAIVLQLACPRPIRYVVYEPIYNQPLLKPILKAFGCIPIKPNRPRDAIKAAAEQIAKGEIVCIFPEGELSRSGILLRLKRGYELIAREANAPVVPVWMDRLWGSIFSFYGGKYFNKIPRQIPFPVMVAFGEPMTAEKADISTVRERMLELGEQCYQQRPILRGHLGMACLRGLKHGQFETAMVDGADHSTLTRGTLLAAGIALSRVISRRCKNQRVAAVLPTGKGALITNLAIVLANKTPVNLNFTAGRSSLESAMRTADLADAVSAHAFAKRFPDFPFPDNLLHLEDVMPGLKKKIALWRVLVFLLPWRVLALLLGLPKKGGHDEAVILFSSGSAGEPKGVVLSHHNVLGNVTQFSSMLNLNRGDAILACLPFFHSFGCTVTLWFPLIEGIRLVSYPNPLEVTKNAELIERYKITLLVSTPTFLRGYLRRVEPKQLASLQLIVTGAEKLPEELANAFKEKFGKEVLQGYGLTETAPVVSVNLPEPPASRPGDSIQPSNRFGSVGKLAPGIAAQIRHPEADSVLLPLNETGMLWLRGPNIFEGYLNDPKRTADVLRDGWFKTGDLARFDEDGFLFIEGRLSRFSKIGGEMVPHETVENKINELYEIASDQERVFSITAVPDEAKGEALVLLAARDLELAELRTKLSEAGMTNLWIPKKIVRLEKIPVLGTGKLDLKACKDAALAAVNA
jgi:acyl-[acyl-carrier-protein]-phospholipid O-acyltransferase/long-chain-fatty-acid--[acyl-carrier-protein] ligase